MLDNINYQLARLLFGKDARIEFYESLGDYLESGTPLLEALRAFNDMLMRQGKKEADTDIIRMQEWIKKIDKGERLSDALRGWIPPVELVLIETCEESGRLVDGLERVVALLEGGGALRGAWIGPTMYPLFLSMMIGGLMNLYGSKILPRFARQSDPQSWSANGKLLYFVTNGVHDYWPHLLVALAIISASVVYSLPRLVGRVRDVLDHVPPYSFYRTDMAAAFSSALTAQFDAGVGIIKALENITKSSTPYLSYKLDPIIKDMKRGDSIGTAMTNQGGTFPDRKMVSMFVLHSGKSSFATAIARQHVRWIAGKIKAMERIGKVTNVISLFVVAAIIGWTSLALSDISSQAAQSGRHDFSVAK